MKKVGYSNFEKISAVRRFNFLYIVKGLESEFESSTPNHKL